LTVWKFDSADGARSALDVLQRLQKEELIQIADAAGEPGFAARG
jgi:uncharacterized membrane protein